MKISWVIADSYQVDPTVNLTDLQNIGPIWGSWRTWRSCGTDNVVCHDIEKAQELIKQNFQSNCNFYIPKNNSIGNQAATGVKFYGGDFESKMHNIEDIVSLHLASVTSDIILMLGFNFSTIANKVQNQTDAEKIKNYYGLSRSIIINQTKTQWVLVDHVDDLDKSFKNIANLTQDNLKNVLKMLLQ